MTLFALIAAGVLLCVVPVALSLLAYRIGYARGSADAALTLLVRCGDCPVAGDASGRIVDRWLD